MRAIKSLCSGINVSTNAGSNARTSPDFPDQQKQLTGRLLHKHGASAEKGDLPILAWDVRVAA